MKKENIEKLKEFISNYELFYMQIELAVVEVYTFYCNEVIETIEDIEETKYFFTKFLRDNINLFKGSNACKYMLLSSLQDFDLYIENALSSISLLRQQKFVYAANEILPNGKDTRILEVGAGRIPYSSMIFARENDKIRSIDEFVMTEEKIKTFNVDGEDGLFSDSTDLSNVDLLVGHAPCEATMSMIVNSVLNDKPYFIKYCECGLPQNRFTGRPINNWKSYLKRIDPKIKIYRGFLYSLDASDKLVKKAIDENYTHLLF